MVPRGLNIHISRVHGVGHSRNHPSVASPLQTPPPHGDPHIATQSDPISERLNQLPRYRKNIKVLKHIPKGARCLAATKLSQIMDRCVQSNDSEDWYNLLTYSYTSLRVPSSDNHKESLTSKVKKNISESTINDFSTVDLAARDGAHLQRLPYYKAIE